MNNQLKTLKEFLLDMEQLDEQNPPTPRPRPRGIGARLAGPLYDFFPGLPRPRHPVNRRPRGNFLGQRGNKPHSVDPFAKTDAFDLADALLAQLAQLADSVYNNLGSLFSDFFEMLGPGYTGAFDAFRMMLRNLIADPQPDQLNNAASAMLDYLFDADMVIVITENGTQMVFSHHGAANAAQNEVIDVFFNGAIQNIPGLLDALIDAFPDSLYGG
tara:strand:+ start:171 stop:815 length:645 start_codon:yes stop_codon:yes gene_type:complete